MEKIKVILTVETDSDGSEHVICLGAYDENITLPPDLFQTKNPIGVVSLFLNTRHRTPVFGLGVPASFVRDSTDYSYEEDDIYGYKKANRHKKAD